MQTLYGDLIAKSLRDGVDWDSIHVSESIGPSDVLKLAVDQSRAHIIQTKNPFFAHDLNTAALVSTHNSALSEFPVSAILAPENYGQKSNGELTIFEQSFVASGEKAQILQNVEATLGQHSIPGSLTADIVLMADELITNALFNAPFVDLENTQPGAAREDEIATAPEKSARLFMGLDKNRVVVGCKDLFGTLNANKLFTRIKNCYDTSVGDNINLTGAGGAGIGSYLIFNSSASYFAEVKIGSHTTICCTAPLRMSSRARLSIAKNLHCLSYK